MRTKAIRRRGIWTRLITLVRGSLRYTYPCPALRPTFVERRDMQRARRGVRRGTKRNRVGDPIHHSQTLGPVQKYRQLV
jgi:hypothetical protein